MIGAVMAIILGTLSGHNLNTTLGSCQFDVTNAGVRFHGTFFQCRMIPGSGHSTLRKLSYNRGHAQWGGDSYSTGEGYLYLPEVGSTMQNSGESIWQGPERKIAVELDISVTMVTDRALVANLDVKIMLIFPLRPPN